MKKIGFLLISLTTLAFIGTSCKPTVAPVSERIKKNWTAQSVKEGSTVVYTKGGASNTKPGYANFSLNLASAPTFTWKTVDGNTFTGSYSLPTDTRLLLTGLTPPPTNTGGSVEFTIISFSDTQMVLARTTADSKTGGTINEYTLVSQ